MPHKRERHRCCRCPCPPDVGVPLRTRTGRGQGLLTIRPGVHSDPRGATQLHPGHSGSQGGPRHPLATVGALDTYRDLRRHRRERDRRHCGPGALRSGGSVLADGLREPSRPWDALHAAGGVGRPVEVPEGLDEGVVVRAARSPRRRLPCGPTVVAAAADLLPNSPRFHRELVLVSSSDGPVISNPTRNGRNCRCVSKVSSLDIRLSKRHASGHSPSATPTATVGSLKVGA